MAKARKLNLFGASSDELAQETIVTQPIASTSSPMTIAQETHTMNTIQQAFDSAHTYTKKVQIPSVNLTNEQIDSMSPQSIFEKLVVSGRIGITRAANETRKQEIPVIFRNNVQLDQLARALAHVEFNVHTAWATQVDNLMHVITLMDNKGDNDRAVIGSVNPIDKKVYYSAHYATKKFNDFGQLIGVVTGEVHPIDQNTKDRVAGYNQWVDAFNAAVKAVAMNVAMPEQKSLLKGLTLGAQDPNQFVQFNTIAHINADSVVNKYQIEAWLLLEMTKPAFEIYTRSKTSESFEQFFAGCVEKMTKAYRSELRKLAGLTVYTEAVQE